MDRGWADAEVALHVGLGGRALEYARIGVDEGQILTPLFGKALPTGATSSGVPLHPQARQLAQYGRDRDRRSTWTVPDSQN
jgi:hypothetical protein